MGRLRPRPGVLICCWSLLGKGVEIETLEIASSGGGKNRYIWNPWVFWTGSFNKLGSSTQQKPRWHQFSIGPIIGNGQKIPQTMEKHSPQKWKNITKKIWTHYRAPICFVEDFRHFSCLGSQDGLGGQFFLWGEPLGSQRFQGDDLCGEIIQWEPVFFWGEFQQKAALNVCFLLFFCEGCPKLTYF